MELISPGTNNGDVQAKQVNGYSGADTNLFTFDCCGKDGYWWGQKKHGKLEDHLLTIVGNQ